MDKRSFIFGLGIGIIFSVIIIWIVYGVSDIGYSQLTDEEIEQKAREFGMEYVSESVFETATENSSETVSYYPPAHYEAETAETAAAIENDNENITVSYDNVLETQNAAEAETSVILDNNSEKTSENVEKEMEDNFIEIKINSGSNAKKVSRILAEKGIIENAEEYENYLINNKKTKSIKTGTFKIPDGVDFEELTNIIIRKP